MSKKNRETRFEHSMREFDPAVEKLALERLLSGKQLYDYKTHQLHRHIRDQVQARAILLRAQALATDAEKKLILRYLEKRLLGRAFENDGSQQG